MIVYKQRYIILRDKWPKHCFLIYKISMSHLKLTPIFLSDTPVGSTNQMTNWDKLCTFSRREIRMNFSTSVNKILILSQQEMINFHTLDDKYLSGIPKSICIHLTFKIKCIGLGGRAITFCRIKKSGMT